MPEKIAIEILYDPANANIAVNGPIANKVLCYGILEAAKLAIKDYDPAKKSPIITPSRFQIPMNGDAGE